jgi:endonuclease YncB( thermonuclease family)
VRLKSRFDYPERDFFMYTRNFAAIRMTLVILLVCLRSLLFAQDSLTVGEFTVSKIIDGDTFRFDGLDRPTRLLGIDTEEMYKGKDAELKTNNLKKDWQAIYDSARAKEKKPIKHESPFGYETWLWAQEKFKDVVKVKLEKEDNDRFIDTYGRYLVYFIAIRGDGSEFNYNVEAVRQGYSAYFTKYGYSKRFHNEFIEAQNYAQEKKLGIWSGYKQCYPDYKERVEWWNRRAEAIKHFEKKYVRTKGYYSVMDERDFHALQNHIGDEVTVFGSIQRERTLPHKILIFCYRTS